MANGSFIPESREHCEDPQRDPVGESLSPDSASPYEACQRPNPRRPHLQRVLTRELLVLKDYNSSGTAVEAKDTITHSESHNMASTKNGSLQEVICVKMERPPYNSDCLNSCLCHLGQLSYFMLLS